MSVINPVQSRNEYFMKRLASVLVLVLVWSAPGKSQTPDHRMKMDAAEKPATLLSGLGSVHHPVTTTNPEAQRFFDQGFALFTHSIMTKPFARSSARQSLIQKLAMLGGASDLRLVQTSISMSILNEKRPRTTPPKRPCR